MDQREDALVAGHLKKLTARTEQPTENQFIAHHGIGDTIMVPCMVKAVHFSKSKVNYVVEIGGYLLSIDSCDTFKPEGAQAGAEPAEIVQVIS